MSARQYPRIGGSRQRKGWVSQPANQGPRCDVQGCDEKALFEVDIQVSWFRGDDECRRSCSTHRGDVDALLAGVA